MVTKGHPAQLLQQAPGLPFIGTFPSTKTKYKEIAYVLISEGSSGSAAYSDEIHSSISQPIKTSQCY